MRKVFCIMAVLGMFILLTAPVVFGQDLDGKWFKVTFTAKGNIEADNGAVGQKQQASVVNYIQFLYNDVWSTQCPFDFYPFYEIHTWYPDGDEWASTYGAINKADEACYVLYGCPYQETTFLDKQFVLYDANDNGMYLSGESVLSGNANTTLIIDIKRGRDNGFKSATLKSLGCSGGFRTADGYSWGSCTINGKSINPDKLPEGIPHEGAARRFILVPACTI